MFRHVDVVAHGHVHRDVNAHAGEHGGRVLWRRLRRGRLWRGRVPGLCPRAVLGTVAARARRHHLYVNSTDLARNNLDIATHNVGGGFTQNCYSI